MCSYLLASSCPCLYSHANIVEILVCCNNEGAKKHVDRRLLRKGRTNAGGFISKDTTDILIPKHLTDALDQQEPSAKLHTRCGRSAARGILNTSGMGGFRKMSFPTKTLCLAMHCFERACMDREVAAARAYS